MSLIRDPDYVKGISLQIFGVQNVQEEACRLIASEAEYMLRRVIQVFKIAITQKTTFVSNTGVNQVFQAFQ